MSTKINQENLLTIVQEYNTSRECRDKGSICHAPESSLYFGRDGLVSACCYSRAAGLGRYPDQSIEEIWTGAQAQAMRVVMRRNDLPMGCELCADELLARNFNGFLARQFDANARRQPTSGLLSKLKSIIQPRKPNHYPVQFEFELSNTCNFHSARYDVMTS